MLIEKKASPVLNSSFLDVKKSSGDFQYNSNGSLVCDGTRGITNIRYDDNNNPIRIQFDNGNVTKYIYTVTGQKLRTIHYTAPKNIHVAMGDEYENIEQNCLSADSTDYLVDGNIIYKNNCFSKILFDGGFIGTNSGTGPTRPIRPVGISDGQYHQQLESWIQLDMNVYGYKFYNKDHLGNIREIVDKNGQICQKTDYYPYGTPILFDPFTINDTSHPYKYNGKELDMMHGLNTYDYGARQYNSALPLWDRVDPLAEKYYHVSPYAYCANNPVNYVDPDGEKPTIYEAALMAKHIYGNNVHLTGGWHISKTQYASFNNAQSGLKSALYERTKSGVTEYAYVTAGTQDIQDIKEDVTQLFGKGVQYKQSVDNARIINKSFEDSELTFVGHSLGGGLAASNALSTGRNAITFNPAAITAETKKNLHLPTATNKSQISNVIVKGEIVNFLQSKIGLKPEGRIKLLDAKYLPGNNPINTGLRVYNHLINTVINKLEEEKK